ncbi:MAG TPA: glycosyltransferase, partial [Flavisolibacter sp.]
MTICIVTDNFPPHTGGIAHFYKYLVSLLACQGHTVIVLTVDSTSTENDTTEFIDGCTKVTLKRSYQELYSYYKAYFRPGGHDAPYWLSAGFAMRKWLLHHAAKFSIDIIEVSDYGGLGAFLTGNNLPPYVITAHSALHQLLPFGHNALTDHIRVIKQLEMLAFSGCSDVIVHSPLNQQSIQNVFLKDAVFSTAPWQPPNIISQQEKNELPLIIGGFQTVK